VVSPTFDGTTHAATIPTGAATITMSAPVTVYAGQGVSGGGLASGTTILQDSSETTITVDKVTTGSTSSGTKLTFGEGVFLSEPIATTVKAQESLIFGSKILEMADTTGVAVGQVVSGTGVVSGSTVVSIDSPAANDVELSNALTEPITTEDITFVTTGTAVTTTGTNPGPLIRTGQASGAVTATAHAPSGFQVAGTVQGRFSQTTAPGTAGYGLGPLVRAGTTDTTNSWTLTLPNFNGVGEGQSVTGTNIADNTKVVAVGGDGVVSLSKKTTGFLSYDHAIAAADFIKGTTTLTMTSVANIVVGQTVTGITVATTSVGIANKGDAFFTLAATTVGSENVLPGQVVTGHAGIKADTWVKAVNTGTKKVTLNQGLSAKVPSNTPLTFKTGIEDGTTVTAINGNDVTLSTGTTAKFYATNAFALTFMNALTFRTSRVMLKAIASLEIAVGQTVWGHAGIPVGTFVTKAAVAGSNHKIELSAELTEDVPMNTVLSFDPWAQYIHTLSNVAATTIGSGSVVLSQVVNFEPGVNAGQVPPLAGDGD
jgi:hypothetical protein